MCVCVKKASRVVLPLHTQRWSRRRKRYGLVLRVRRDILLYTYIYIYISCVHTSHNRLHLKSASSTGHSLSSATIYKNLPPSIIIIPVQGRRNDFFKVGLKNISSFFLKGMGAKIRVFIFWCLISTPSSVFTAPMLRKCVDRNNYIFLLQIFKILILILIQVM